jgi:phage baseplate assembly protein W
MKTESFLGKGWSFPPTFDLSNKSIEMVENQKDIEQSLEILLSTSVGERVLRSDYGCDLTAMLFESITVTLLTKIKRIIERAITQYEPRIDLNNIFFTNQNKNQLEGIINIQLEYTIRSTNSRLNFVYPFYIKEGTNIKN